MQTYGMSMRRTILAGVCAGSFIMAGTVWAQGTWVEELGNVLAFYQTLHPGLDWTPYIDELTRARDGMRAGDQLTVTHAINEFQKMLRTRAHGLDAEVAEDLYTLTLTVRTSEDWPFAEANGSKDGSERLMRVPDGTIESPYKGDVRCHEGGCDYWLGHMFDPGAG